VLNERPGLIQIAGAVVVCLGVLAACWQAQPQQDFPADPPSGQVQRAFWRRLTPVTEGQRC
jgi:drug/metabolite transporter (DMT)-like permease